MLQNFSGVQHPDRLFMSHARGNQLPSSGITGHEMGFDQSDSNPQVGIKKPAIDPNRYPAGPIAQIAMIFVATGKMINHPNGFDDPVASNDFTQLFTLIGPVQTRCHQYGDEYGPMPAAINS